LTLIMMIILLLFLQKQNLANAIYLFGLGTLLNRSLLTLIRSLLTLIRSISKKHAVANGGGGLFQAKAVPTILTPVLLRQNSL